MIYQNGTICRVSCHLDRRTPVPWVKEYADQITRSGLLSWGDLYDSIVRIKGYDPKTSCYRVQVISEKGLNGTFSVWSGKISPIPPLELLALEAE